MKVVILAGGLGTRISEESQFKPKPMIEIGGMPILWHIMKLYSKYGFDDFIICAGYKQEYIKKWFSDFMLISSDVTFDFENDKIKFYQNKIEKWKVTIINTGLKTQTGGRIKRLENIIGNETFMVTYGDAVGDVNIKELLSKHNISGKIGTISLYNFGQSKGVVEVQNDEITTFREKSDLDGDLINIGFMVFNPDIFNYIQGDGTILEKEPMQMLIKDKQLGAYVHKGFWQCMDTLKEKQKLEHLWENNIAPWKVW